MNNLYCDVPTLSGCGGANEMVGRWSALQEMHILKSLWCWEMPSCRGDESFLGSCFARWFCCLEHCWGLSSFSSISSLIVVSLIIMFITSVVFFYLIWTFSCVNLRFCFRCLHLRSLTSPFPLQTGLQTCGVMLKLLQMCKMFLLILCVISKLFYKLQLAMAMTTFIIISS